jgi:sugar/nucleoside kinase (ribokinase family)
MADLTSDVVVVGNVGIDTNIYLPGTDIDFSVEANFTENIDYVGQAGGFTSRGYAQLGKRTAFIGTVGQDYNGDLIRKTLTNDGIDITGLFIDPAGTARSINFMYRDGRRKNFYDGKGHMTLQPDRALCRLIFSGGRLAHFHLPNWARTLLPLAKECGLTIGVDIQDVVAPDDPYRQDFIQFADVLFFSATNYPDPTPIIKLFLAIRPELIIVVGMGADGCALGTVEGIRYFGPVEMDRPVVDTNGAGDGLAVGFLSSFVLDGYSLEDSVLRGQIAARYTCSLRGTSQGLINTALMEKYYRQNVE